MLANIYSKDISSGGCGWPSTCLSMQWWHEVEMENPILLGCRKCDHDTFMNAHGSFEVLQSVSKVVSVVIFSKLYIMLVSIVIE